MPQQTKEQFHYWNMRYNPDNNGGYYPPEHPRYSSLEGFGDLSFIDQYINPYIPSQLQPWMHTIILTLAGAILFLILGAFMAGISFFAYWRRIRTFGLLRVIRSTLRQLIDKIPVLSDNMRMYLMMYPIIFFVGLIALGAFAYLWYTGSRTPVYNIIPQQNPFATLQWKNPAAAAYLSTAMALYGQPDFIEYAPGGIAVWEAGTLAAQGMPFIHVELTDEAVAHCFPQKHFDFLNVSIKYQLSGADCTGYPIAMKKVLRLSGGLTYDAEKRWLSAKCDSHEACLAMLVLATRVNTGQITLAMIQDIESLNKMLMVLKADPRAGAVLMNELVGAIHSNVITPGAGIRGDTAKLVLVEELNPVERLGVGDKSVWGDQMVDYYDKQPACVPYDSENMPEQYVYLHIQGQQA